MKCRLEGRPATTTPVVSPASAIASTTCATALSLAPRRTQRRKLRHDSVRRPYDFEIRQFRHAVSEPKKEHIDRCRTAVHYIDKGANKDCTLRSLPRSHTLRNAWIGDSEYEIEGLWFGDVIHPATSIRGDGRMATVQDHRFFGPTPNCPGEEVAHVMPKHVPNIADENILEQLFAYLNDNWTDGIGNLRRQRTAHCPVRESMTRAEAGGIPTVLLVLDTLQPACFRRQPSQWLKP